MSHNYKTKALINQYAAKMAEVLTQDVAEPDYTFFGYAEGQKVYFEVEQTGTIWYYLPVDDLLNADISFADKIYLLRSYEPTA